MKVFKDDKYYVEFESLVKHGAPDWLEFDKDKYEKGDYVVISDPRGIKYIKSRVDIIDHDDVKDLTEKQLDSKIERISNKLERYALRILNTRREERHLLFRDKDFLRDYYLCEDIYYPLIEYRNNKEEIDNKIKEVTGSKTLVRGK